MRASDRIAVLTPDANALSSAFAGRLSEGLAPAFVVLDQDLAKSAYDSVTPLKPFNMSVSEARAVASVIGCELFVEVKASTQRRNAAGRGDYYEAFAVIYVVSGRTGRLIYWGLEKFEGKHPDDAENGLLKEAEFVAETVRPLARSRLSNEIKEPPLRAMEVPPPDGSAEAKNFKAPIPFRRIKPEYTSLAAFYEAAGTVEIEVDLDEHGQILRTEIVKWAGFGLDESVEKAVREMNWRPAERNGKFLPMRFLLRYNFKKLEKE